ERDEAGCEFEFHVRHAASRHEGHDRSERLLPAQADADAALQRRALGTARPAHERRAWRELRNAFRVGPLRTRLGLRRAIEFWSAGCLRVRSRLAGEGTHNRVPSETSAGARPRRASPPGPLAKSA